MWEGEIWGWGEPWGWGGLLVGGCGGWVEWGGCWWGGVLVCWVGVWFGVGGQMASGFTPDALGVGCLGHLVLDFSLVREG